MPDAPRLQSLTRQWDTLLRIPVGPPGITSAELTAYLNERGYKVGKRTVERDLNELSGTFALTVLDPDKKPYRWIWCRNRLPELGTLSVSDALSLCIMGNILESVLPQSLMTAFAQKLEQAQRTLDAMEPTHPVVRWRHKVRYVPAAMQLLPPKLDEAVLQTVQQAVLKEKQLEVRYQAFNAKSADKKVLNPLGMIIRGTVPYLVTTIEPFDNTVHLALHRMRQPKVLTTPLKLPKEGFNFNDFIISGKPHFGTAKTIKLQASISNDLAQYLTETPLAKDQKIAATDDPHYWILTATVPDTWQLEMWILSQAEHIQVLAPKSLKTLIHNRLKIAFERY